MAASDEKFAYTTAITHLPLDSTEKYLLTVLALIFNPEFSDNIYPRVKTIAQRISKSEAHTRKLLSKLSKEGWLIIEDAKTLYEGASELSHTSNRYYLAPSILAHEKAFQIEEKHQRALIYGSLEDEEVQTLKKALTEAKAHLEQEKKKASELKPRESQINGRKGFEARYPNASKKKEEARACMVINLSKLRKKIVQEEVKEPSSASTVITPILAPKEAPTLALANGAPRIDARLNTNLNKNLNKNIKTKLSDFDEKINISFLKPCIDLFCQKLGKTKPSGFQILRFEKEFIAKGFTLERFEKNLQMILSDENLRSTTYSIVRVLSLDAALKSKEIMKKTIFEHYEHCKNWGINFDPMETLGAHYWFKNGEEAQAWMKVECTKKPSVSRSTIESKDPLEGLEEEPIWDLNYSFA